MSENKETSAPEGTATTVKRTFEQPPDAKSFYSDFGQVINTGNEIILQFYETIPGAPAHKGEIQTAKSLLRTTITLSMHHAQNIGNLLVEKTKEDEK